jgi:ABC-type antimicrobial peptide transport system permease subunit
METLAAFALTRLMSGFVYGINLADPFTYGAIALLLFVVALVACLVPAQRATRVSPLTALTYE